jgi:sortase A
MNGQLGSNLVKVRGRSMLGKLQIALLLAGTLALGYAGFVTIRGHLYQKNALRQLEQTERDSGTNSARSGTPSERSPDGRWMQRVVAGSSFARMAIDRLHVNVAVIEGDSDADLRLGAGHIPYTALPGDSGNVGIAAHRDTFFRPLRNIRKGDIISVFTPGETYRYAVDSTQIVTPEHSEVLLPTTEPSLTLVTCYPFYYVGSAPKRFIVRAHQVSAASPSRDQQSGS